eukprot:COSAG05_NODE_2208_length_3395_cov_3.434466_4_plen_88_part_00
MVEPFLRDTFSTHPRAAARQFMHRYVIFSQNAPSIQPAMRALAGWPIAYIQHCTIYSMHAEPRGSQITGRYMHDVRAVKTPCSCVSS